VYKSIVPIRVGDRIDRYTLQEPLGEGGQAAVWKVVDPLDGGVIRALKLVPIERAAPDAFERARREARALSKAPHPCLIACHGLFEDINAGVIGIVLDLVEGRPLNDVANDPQMTHTHRVALLEQLAAALAHVHSAAMVHRDLKPENVLVTDVFFSDPGRLGTIKLVDFGIAAQLGNPRPLTAKGSVIGTAPYLAPEELDRDEPAHGATTFGRDMFAFGVLASELLLGGHPTGLALDAPHHELVRAYRAAASGRLPWPPLGLTGPWGAAIRACLALDPRQRPASGAALLDLVRAGDEAAPRPLKAMDTRPHVVRSESQPGFTEPMAPRRSAPPVPTEPNVVLQVPRKGGRPSIPATRVRRRRWSNTALVAAPAVMTAAIVIGVGLSLLRPSAPDTERAPVVTAIPVPVVNPAPSPSPVSLLPEPVPTAQIAPPAICPNPCCGGSDCSPSLEESSKSQCERQGDRCEKCKSGRACVRRACDSYLKPDEKWLFRPVGVKESGAPQPSDPRGLDVCVRRSNTYDKWTCNPLIRALSPEDSKRLRVSTEDLTKTGIDIQIKRKGRQIGFVQGARVVEGRIMAGALCKGLIIRLQDDRLDWISAFLDEPK
jgi:eukaryotic-like serine/threonine-protein kinase